VPHCSGLPGHASEQVHGGQLRYVNESKERGLVFRPGKQGVTVRVFIDASYGAHTDGKSRTRSYIVVGET
jgi:hypothetical protein